MRPHQHIEPVEASLPTGFMVALVHTCNGVITGDQTVQSIILGPGTLEGQSAIEVKDGGTQTIDLKSGNCHGQQL